ncbi:hypothetical protein SAMN05421788_102118 [Filimonas lacunae]|uniref:Short chain amide porin n=1 Tax=Filimonas lacunae TaxID=477680 RepID=A0A173MIM7_9BACT|nr:hypothetical protein [Filimonas lacunae]BAV07258.1 outer membrane porin FmdC [Filimonas lacunae]SIS92415.1 hypothetical protein SAMN05421788_102118 [Filimonas lacunae]
MGMLPLKKLAAVTALLGGSFCAEAQDSTNDQHKKPQLLKDGKIWLNEDGSNYFKFTLLTQVWVRNTDVNPGSTVNGYAKSNITDIGIRRARMQAFGQIADRVFIYTQVGMNNYSYTADRKAGFFIHDVTGEYEVVRKKLSLGAGLTAWNGLTRYASPSVGSIMGLDAPLFEQTTNDVTDQFLRKLSIYAKGKLGRLDYRLVMSDPMNVTKSAGYSSAISSISNFSPMPANMQFQGYLQWQFLDPEGNTTPYATGTYLGTKKVFNIGAGFQYQKNAMWHQGATGDTVSTDLKHFAVDVYYDAPVNKEKGSAISAYGTFINFDHGPGYLRNQATMNPATGSNTPAVINGSGNGYPSFGTGNLLYAQVGYKFNNNLVGNTTFMPYASIQHASYERLDKAMNYWEAGVNWLLKGHTSKLTFTYQNRPIYEQQTAGNATLTGHKGAFVMQYQVFLQ